MADNRIAYGMLKKAGIDTEGMSPKEAWEKVEELGLQTSSSRYGKNKRKKPNLKVITVRNVWLLSKPNCEAIRLEHCPSAEKTSL